MEEKSILKGSCLCQAVQFEIDGPIHRVMHCHCSLCRKVSGTASNAVTFVPMDSFRWIAGQSQTKRLEVTTSTARGDRRVIICQSCGSPLPDTYDGHYMCVQVGLIDDYFEPKLVVNHHLADKGWQEPPSENTLNFEGVWEQ